MFAPVNMIKNRKVKSIEDEMKNTNKLYPKHGFKITCIDSDREFEHLCSEMADLGISLNCASKKKHVPEIERFHENVKERV